LRGLPGRVVEPVDWAPAAIDVSRFADAIRDDVKRRVEALSSGETK
jgi:hypothetical protein